MSRAAYARFAVRAVPGAAIGTGGAALRDAVMPVSRRNVESSTGAGLLTQSSSVAAARRVATSHLWYLIAVCCIVLTVSQRVCR